ncbi:MULTISPECIES: antibiotic biosynthesis monooxygenase [unclassified Mycobacterium]|uniref:putative quinol monooxygenase n=1 Tax=unclassified Mycobacterium TaxID=2642494 RepID=UPI0009F3E63F
MYGPDEEVVLITEATALPGRGDDLRRAFVRLIPQSQAEGAVNTFRLHEDRDRPGHFTLYQRFRNQHGVDRHVQTDHFAVSVEAIAQFAEGGKAQTTFYRVLSR